MSPQDPQNNPQDRPQDRPHDDPQRDPQDDSQGPSSLAKRRSPRKHKPTMQVPRAAPPKKPKPPPVLEVPVHVEQAGIFSETTGMAVIHPPPKPHEPEAVEILRRIHKLLKEMRYFNKFVKFVEENKDPEEESARWIQGGRLEVFVSARGKKSTAFDTILGRQLRQGAKEKILDYCRAMACQDPRIKKSNYSFDNFSLLVSWGKCPAQIPHIDLVHPNFQFGLLVSNGRPGTHFLPDPDKMGHLQTVEQLEHFWNTDPYFTDLNAVTGPAPENILKALDEDNGAMQLLEYFGDTLHPERSLVENMTNHKSLPVGALVSLPGGIVHAGPASHEFRAILFFSGSRKVRGGKAVVASYMPDTQYNGTTLLAHLVSIVWRRDGVGTNEREYLLRRLAHYVERTKDKHVVSMCGEGELTNFITTILEKKLKGAEKEEYIKMKSKARNMLYGTDPFSDAIIVVDPNVMEQISAPKMFTIYEGEELPISVYWDTKNNKIILRYHCEGNGFDIPDEYEGHSPGVVFKLVWSDGRECDANNFSREKFDGTNGQVYTDEGEPIEMYVGRRDNKKQRIPTTLGISSG